MVLSWCPHGASVVDPLWVHGAFVVGRSWVYGDSVVLLWGLHGASVVDHGVFVVFPQCPHGVHMVSL